MTLTEKKLIVVRQALDRSNLNNALRAIILRAIDNGSELSFVVIRKGGFRSIGIYHGQQMNAEGKLEALIAPLDPLPLEGGQIWQPFSAAMETTLNRNGYQWEFSELNETPQALQSESL